MRFRPARLLHATNEREVLTCLFLFALFSCDCRVIPRSLMPREVSLLFHVLETSSFFFCMHLIAALLLSFGMHIDLAPFATPVWHGTG